MDLRQVEYILKIADENNITRAAEKLFITQSALNQQLLKLERELGTPLFYRSRANWRLTEAGEIYVENARRLLSIKQDTYERIGDIAALKNRTLSIGFTPGRGISMFVDAYAKFHRKYPEITVQPVERRVSDLQSMIANDQLDLAFLTLRESEYTRDEYILLKDEEILLLLPENHPRNRERGQTCGLTPAVLDLAEVKDEPFVLINTGSTLRALENELFEQAGFQPHVLFETENNTTILQMIRSVGCLGLIPHYYVRHGHDGMACFALPSHPHWNMAVSFRKGRYLSEPMRDFIGLARDFLA